MIYRFAGFELDGDSGSLRHGESSVTLPPQPCRLLEALLSRPGQVVSRQELVSLLWGSETLVDVEHGLNFCVLQVRTALGDDARKPRFLETLPRRGYRFIAPVETGTAILPRPARRTGHLGLMLALAAVAILGVALAQRWLTSTTTSTVAPDRRAHEAFLRGRAHWAAWTTAGMREAVHELETATTLAPRYTAAQLALADAYHALTMRGVLSPAESRPKIEAALAAAERAGDSTRVRAFRGTIRLWYGNAPEEAERELRDAVALSPHDASARNDLGWALIARGAFDQGLAEILRAQADDPLSARITGHAPWAYLYAGRYDDAIASAQQVLARNRDSGDARMCLATAHLLRGDARSAASMLALAGAFGGDDSWQRDPAGAIRRFRMELIRTLEKRGERQWVDPYALAVEYAAIGEHERARRQLNRAIEAGSPSVALMNVDPRLMALRNRS